MIDSYNMFVMQIFLLCLMIVGFITAKTRIVDTHARSSLSDLVLDVFLPCNIVSSFFGTARSQLPSMGIILLVSAGILALSMALSRFVLYRKTGAEQKKVLTYGTLISNASFLGNPVVESIYGIEGLTYAAAYLVPIRVALWTFGITIFSTGKVSIKKIIFHPCLIATFLGLVIMVSGFNPPSLVSRLAFSLGNCTTPVSMLVIGNILGFADPKKLVSGLTVYFTLIRLVLIPLLVTGILLPLRLSPMISGISVILSGMPAAATTSILADKFGADSELASRIVFTSTLLSIVTAPLLALLLQRAL